MTESVKLKILFGNTVFWFVAGLFSQIGADEAPGTSVAWLYFHGYSIFFLLSAVFAGATYYYIERNRDRQLINFRAPKAWFWVIFYTITRMAAFGAGALAVSILVLERINSDYGYAVLALLFYLPVSLVAVVVERITRKAMVKRGILKPLKEVGLDESHKQETSTTAVFWLILLIIFGIVTITQG